MASRLLMVRHACVASAYDGRFVGRTNVPLCDRGQKQAQAIAAQHVADVRVSRRYKLPSGEFKEDPCFVGIVAWERQAELAGEYLKKGSSILVEGSCYDTASGYHAIVIDEGGLGNGQGKV